MRREHSQKSNNVRSSLSPIFISPKCGGSRGIISLESLSGSELGSPIYQAGGSVSELHVRFGCLRNLSGTLECSLFFSAAGGRIRARVIVVPHFCGNAGSPGSSQACDFGGSLHR